MNKTLLTGLLCCSLSIQSFADQPLEGFTYGSVNAPTGKEWESPENLALNKEQPHAYFFPFQHLDNARKVLPENSKFWQSLDGDWKFHWAPAPKISIRLSMMSAHGMRFPYLQAGIFMAFKRTEARSTERLSTSTNRSSSSTA